MLNSQCFSSSQVLFSGKKRKKVYSYWVKIFFLKSLLSTRLLPVLFLFTKNQQHRERQPGLTSVYFLVHFLGCSCVPVVVSLFLLSPTKRSVFLCSSTSVAHIIIYYHINGLRPGSRDHLTFFYWTSLTQFTIFLYDMMY